MTQILRITLGTCLICTVIYRFRLRSTLQPSDDNGNSPALTRLLAARPYVPSSFIYGCIHIPRTGGTVINNALVARYQRICGHGGYSYDAYRTKTMAKTNPLYVDSISRYADSIGRSYKGFDRTHVPLSIMEEIGFEDCDWISIEADAPVWKQFNDAAIAPMELHVPCRDPVEHLMSICDLWSIPFKCDAKDLTAEIKKCLRHLTRFSADFETDPAYANINLKCFDYRETTGRYLEYLDERLQTRRVQDEFPNKGALSSNQRKRKCIWENPALMDYVRTYLVQSVDYYNYCDRCLGSKDDLFGQRVQKL